MPGRSLGDEEDEGDDEPVTKVVVQEGSFDKIVVWRHDERPDGIEDQYIRGISEWIGMAKAVSSTLWY